MMDEDQILGDLLPATVVNRNEPINSNFLLLIGLDPLQQSTYEPLYLESLQSVYSGEYKRAELIVEEERRMNNIVMDVIADYLYESPLEFSITGQE